MTRWTLPILLSILITQACATSSEQQQQVHTVIVDERKPESPHPASAEAQAELHKKLAATSLLGELGSASLDSPLDTSAWEGLDEAMGSGGGGLGISGSGLGGGSIGGMGGGGAAIGGMGGGGAAIGGLGIKGHGRGGSGKGGVGRGVGLGKLGTSAQGSTANSSTTTQPNITVDLEVAQIQGQGKLPSNMLTRFLRRRSRTIQACMRRRITQTSAATIATATIQMNLDPKGSVDKVTLVSSTLEPALNSCVVELMERMTFPNPRGSMEIEITLEASITPP